MIETIRHFHMFCGAGGGALGFNRGEARVGALVAKFHCLGGVDSDPAACRDFTNLVGTAATCLDLFSREQYEAFHGKKPPSGWREATPADLRRAAGNETPDIRFLSAPCKGFSGLLSAARASSPKYDALNGLALRGLMLALEAWGDRPPALILFENVPRIAQRGRQLLDRIMGLLAGSGYAARETTHDAGEIGGLAQHRRRFLLVARHQVQVPAFLYEPSRRRVRSIGEELALLPPPGAESAGPMHALPQLTWPTWVRLALIPAGRDWRALRGLDLSKFGLTRYGDHAGKMRVEPWEGAAHTLTGSDRVGSGALSVADVRWGDYGQYGVLPLDQPSGADIIPPLPGAGLYNNICRLVRWADASACITGGGTPTSGGLSVADPRAESWANAGHYGVVPWGSSAGTVTSAAAHDNGRHNVADPRLNNLTDVVKLGPPIIVSLDGTWHRPITTLECAALQGLPVAGLVLDGRSHSRWREAIGNMVPPPAAQAIAGMMGQVLLLARSGQTFALSSTPIWVRGIALALTVDGHTVEVST